MRGGTAMIRLSRILKAQCLLLFLGLVIQSVYTEAEEKKDQAFAVHPAFGLINYTDVSKDGDNVVPSLSLNPNINASFNFSRTEASFYYSLEYVEESSGGKGLFSKTLIYNNPGVALKVNLIGNLAMKFSDDIELYIYPDSGMEGGNGVFNYLYAGPSITLPIGTELFLQFAHQLNVFPNEEIKNDADTRKSFSDSLQKQFPVVDQASIAKNVSTDLIGSRVGLSHNFPTKTNINAYYRYFIASSNNPMEEGTQHRVQAVFGQALGKKTNLELFYRYEQMDYANKTVEDRPDRPLSSYLHRIIPGVSYQMTDTVGAQCKFEYRLSGPTDAPWTQTQHLTLGVNIGL